MYLSPSTRQPLEPYWDIDTDEPIEHKTVSLEEYLELVCRVTVKTDNVASAGTNAALSLRPLFHGSLGGH